MTVQLKVDGMTCQNCVRHVKEALEAVEGVTSAEVDLTGGRAVVDGSGLDTQQLVAAVEEEGYSAQPI